MMIYPGGGYPGEYFPLLTVTPSTGPTIPGVHVVHRRSSGPTLQTETNAGPRLRQRILSGGPTLRDGDHG